MIRRHRRTVIRLSLRATGCGAPHLATVERATSSLVGQETTALACIGEPSRAAAGCAAGS
jgi:hypothetical protein